MRFNKITSADDFKLINSFDAVKQTLLEDDRYSERLEKPLAYWALPNDRRLPLAFLGRTLGDLLATPFEELSATPGIGQKKINSLVTLLNRATRDDEIAPAAGEDSLAEQEDVYPARNPTDDEGHFDAQLVSEVMWQRWRETVRRHQVEQAALGRLAPSLLDLPTVIWSTPLEAYLELSLAEIRRLKTHGEKRVRVILEIFYRVHETLDLAQGQPHLAIQLRPKFIAAIEKWGYGVLDGDELPSRDEILKNLTQPLVEQIKHDAGETVHSLATGRLGVGSAPMSVRMQSRVLGVTRARIYQLLEDCQKIMTVRWNEGGLLLDALVAKAQSSEASEEVVQLLTSTRDLCFSNKQASTEEGHLEDAKPLGVGSLEGRDEED
ncbi:MAG: hypothetical protein WDZ51_02060 [Pirellulaceae bacterium]